MQGNFQQLGLPESFIQALEKQELVQPTGIQSQVIPQAMTGRDIIGQSPTGTGKTLAYLLPLLAKMDGTKREVQGVVLAPTHELAIQIHRQAEQLLTNSGSMLKAVPMIGNVNIARQVEKLKEKPQLIIGSAGRILELIQKRKINAQTIKILVLDEADRLLDEQNLETVKALIKTTQKDRQLLLFSATMPPASLEMAKGLMKEPLVLLSSQEPEAAPDITHIYFTCEQRDKIEMLRKLVRTLPIQQGLVFINKGEAIEETVEKLNYHGLSAAGIYGSLIKSDRQKGLEAFRSGKVQLLVASDMAARGLDISGMEYVINLDTPEDPQVYLHRVGRTGRAGAKGTAISLVTFREQAYLQKWQSALRLQITHKFLAQGKVWDAKPPVKRTTEKSKGSKGERKNTKREPRR